MPHPSHPTAPQGTEDVTTGTPEPIVDDALAPAAPDDVRSDDSVPMEADTGATTPGDALPMEQPVAIADESRSFTALTYLRDSTPQGVLVHVTVTADGQDPVSLDQIELGFEFSDGQVHVTTLPAETLEPTRTWEADLLLEAVVTDLAPGASVVRYTWGDQPDQYSRL